MGLGGGGARSESGRGEVRGQEGAWPDAGRHGEQARGGERSLPIMHLWAPAIKCVIFIDSRVVVCSTCSGHWGVGICISTSTSASPLISWLP